MKKRIGSVLLALALCLSLLPATALAEGEGDTESGTTKPSASEKMPTYSGGNGTESEPWLISSVADLQLLANTINNGDAAKFDANCTDTGGGIPGNYHDYYFKQTKDLDLSNIASWDPIGYSGGCYFAGHYDGDGHTISKAKSTGKNDDEGFATAGIFGWVAFGSVKNLTVKNADFFAEGNKNMSYAGGVLAVAYSCTVENCSVYDSKIESRRNPNNSTYAGGITGIALGSSFEKCASIENTIRHGSFGGGFIGAVDEENSKFTNCYVANCIVTGCSDAGYNTTLSGGFLSASMGPCDAILNNCFVYDCVAQPDETSKASDSFGVFAANTQYGEVVATSCFYYDVNANDATVNAEGAVSKTVDEFANGNVARLLGDAFTQGKDGYPVFPVPATGITLNHSTLSLAVGGSVALTATLTPENATDAVVWSSNNKEIAEVSNNGTVTAKALGTATITATVGSYTATCEVTVAVPVTGVSLDKATMSLTAGSTGTLTATITPENATNKDLTWTSDKEEVATVSDGVVSAVAAGTAHITVTTADGGKTATCVVTVTRRSSSSSKPSYPITTPDKTENGSVTVTPTSAKRGSVVTITVTPDAGYVLDKLTVTDKDGKELSLTKKSDTEYTFVMPAGKVEITPSFVKQAEEPSRVFVDVKTGDYFYDAVQWAVGKGITNGTSAETFSPEAPCTRAQIVTFLWRAAGSPVVNYAMDLSDVAGDAYYAEAVRWALSEGITTGTSADQFSPDATCTREQAVTFLYRAAGSPAVSGESAFEDVGADAYYARAVAWAAQNGVTNGISQALFGTGSDCTRAQIVTFLYRAQQGK